MADFKIYQSPRFRSPRVSDLSYISRWLAEITGQSAVWRRRFTKLLKWEWEQSGSLMRQNSWMAVAGRRRLFYLEFVSTERIYITAAPGIGKERLALYLLEAIAFLETRGIRTIPANYRTFAP